MRCIFKLFNLLVCKMRMIKYCLRFSCRSKLSSLFNSEQLGSGNESFTYTAPKEPKKIQKGIFFYLSTYSVLMI